MKPVLTIQISQTPNPHALKLTLNRTVATQGETYRGDPAAVASPWGKALLSVPGIVGVYGINNFISISKTAQVDWPTLMPAIDAALRRVFKED